VPSGTLYFNTGASTANLISSQNPGSSLLIQGTQDQLLTAFGAVSLTAGCGGGLAISATVEAGGGIKNVFNNHYYRLVKTPVSFDDAVALSAQATFDGTPSGTPGYLATITSPEENAFLFTVMGGAGNNAWLGASDRDVEGDWKWMTGPEAGTSFYTGNVNEPNHGPVNNEFNGWAAFEPNQSGDEDYAEVYGDGRWNDIPSNGGPQNFYLIEWGGMPGDNFSSSVSISDTDTLAASNPFAAGEGTEASPYEVSTLAELAKVGECSGDNIHFKQTADFDLTGTALTPFGTWDNYFTGVYEGNNHKIEGITVDSGDESLFGYVGNGPERTVIKNLDVSGTISVIDDSYAALVATEASGTDFLNIDVQVAVVTEEYARYIGGVVGRADNSTFTNINVSGTMQLFDTTRVGGLIGQGDAISISNVTSDVDFTGTDGGRLGGLAGRLYDNSVITNAVFTGSINVSSVYEVGGLVGYMDTGSITKSYSTASITSVDGEDSIGGLVGETYEVELVEVFATGNVEAATAYNVGGLIGRSEYTSVTDSYATGDVTASSSAGALIGLSYELLALRVHAIGSVISTGSDLGLFGYNDGGNAVEDSFWSPDFLGLLEANVNQLGNETVVTVAQARDLATYQAKNWAIGAEAVVAGNVWTICADFNEGTPFLSYAFPNACLDLQVLKPVPTITGSGAALSELTAVPGTWDDGTTLTYTWYADGVEIVGATAGTYTPTLAQIGAQITVKVTSTKEGYVTENATSSPVGPISAAVMTNKPVPTVSGSGTVGQSLTVNTGTWDADVVLTYKWFLNGVEISGATSVSFTPTADQVGGAITVEVTGTKTGYVTEIKLSAGKTVKAVPKPVVKPTAKVVEFGGMAGNSWWMTDSMKSGVRKAVKANSSMSTLVCTGVVKAGGTKAWMKTLGLKRAEAGCWIAKMANPKLKVSYKYVISKPTDKVQRGFTLTFNK
jgi:Lectin C-type domain/The GLUG motif